MQGHIGSGGMGMGMGLRFNPGVEQDGIFCELPQPITRLQVQDHWDFERFQVLLAEGDYTAGLTRRGVDIAVTGQVARRDGLLLLSEQEMFQAIEELRERFTAQSEEKFAFYLYRDEAAESCRFFRDCSVVKFQCDLSQPELYGYSLTLHADDPVMHAEWPGA